MGAPDDALMLDLIYPLEGVAGRFMSADGKVAAGLTVVDATAGLEQTLAGGIELASRQPAARVRYSELVAGKIDPRRDLVDGFLTFNGVRWQVATYHDIQPGVELALMLREAKP